MVLNVSKYLASYSIVQRRIENSNSASFFQRLSHDTLLPRKMCTGGYQTAVACKLEAPATAFLRLCAIDPSKRRIEGARLSERRLATILLNKVAQL